MGPGLITGVVLYSDIQSKRFLMNVNHVCYLIHDFDVTDLKYMMRFAYKMASFEPK